MFEFLKEFFSSKEAFTRAMRATGLAVAAIALTPEGQAALSGIGGYANLLVPLLGALFGGGVAVGEKNPQPGD